MTRLFAVFLASSCAFGAGKPIYAPGDPLGAGKKPTTLYDAGISTSSVQKPLLRTVLADGYTTSRATFGIPVIAMFVKKVYRGEAAMLVERYTEADGNAVDRDTFLRNLSPTKKPAPVRRHTIGSKSFTVRHGIDFTVTTRRIPPGDPYVDYLGSHYKPPRLGFLERRRFLRGGEAYRLYRCRRLYAWGILRDYRRARAKEKLHQFFRISLTRADRRIITACFGRTVIVAVSRGDPVHKIAKPSMYRLRIMAREERATGAVRRTERECIHLMDIPGGFLILRYRAPRDQFSREHSAFETLLESFVYLRN